MNYRTLMHEVLSASSAITDIVGVNISALRALPSALPPYILTEVASHEQMNTLTEVDPLDHARVRCHLYGESYNVLLDLEEAVRNAMNGATTFSAQYIFGFEMFEDDTKLYHLVLDFSLWHDN